MTRRLVIAAALTAALGGWPLLAQGPGPRMGGPGRGGRGGPGAGILPLLQQLDLTDQQREQLRTLAESEGPPADPGQLREAELKLHTAVLGDSPDPQAIESAKAAIDAAVAAELDHRIAMLTKIAQILTADQRQQLLTLLSAGPRGRGRGL